jgi:hypothetical protein
MIGKPKEYLKSLLVTLAKEFKESERAKEISVVDATRLLRIQNFQHLLHFGSRFDQQFDFQIGGLRTMVSIGTLQKNCSQVLERDVAALLAIELGENGTSEFVDRKFFLFLVQNFETVEMLRGGGFRHGDENANKISKVAMEKSVTLCHRAVLKQLHHKHQHITNPQQFFKFFDPGSMTPKADARQNDFGTRVELIDLH